MIPREHAADLHEIDGRGSRPLRGWSRSARARRAVRGWARTASPSCSRTARPPGRPSSTTTSTSSPATTATRWCCPGSRTAGDIDDIAEISKLIFRIRTSSVEWAAVSALPRSTDVLVVGSGGAGLAAAWAAAARELTVTLDHQGLAAPRATPAWPTAASRPPSARTTRPSATPRTCYALLPRHRRSRTSSPSSPSRGAGGDRLAAEPGRRVLTRGRRRLPAGPLRRRQRQAAAAGGRPHRPRHRPRPARRARRGRGIEIHGHAAADRPRPSRTATSRPPSSTTASGARLTPAPSCWPPAAAATPRRGAAACSPPTSPAPPARWPTLARALGAAARD